MKNRKKNLKTSQQSSNSCFKLASSRQLGINTIVCTHWIHTLKVYWNACGSTVHLDCVINTENLYIGGEKVITLCTLAHECKMADARSYTVKKL